MLIDARTPKGLELMQTLSQKKGKERKVQEPLCFFKYIVSQQVYIYIHV